MGFPEDELGFPAIGRMSTPGDAAPRFAETARVTGLGYLFGLPSEAPPAAPGSEPDLTVKRATRKPAAKRRTTTVKRPASSRGTTGGDAA